MVRHFLENPTGRAPEQQVKLTFITQQIWKLVGNGWWWCIPDSVQPLTYLICTNDNQNRKTLLKLWKRLENGAHPNFRIRFIYTEEELYMCFNWKHIFDHKSFLVDFRTSGRQTNKKKKISLRTLQEGEEKKNTQPKIRKKENQDNIFHNRATSSSHKAQHIIYLIKWLRFIGSMSVRWNSWKSVVSHR